MELVNTRVRWKYKDLKVQTFGGDREVVKYREGWMVMMMMMMNRDKIDEVPNLGPDVPHLYVLDH